MADRTKIKLANSLKKLLAKKSFNKITVQNIVDECGVSRMTFYYYFHDTYDLVSYSFKVIAEHIIASNKDCEKWETGMTALLEGVVKDRVIIENVLHSVGRAHIDKFLTQSLTDLLETYIVQTARVNELSNGERRFLRDMYVNGVSGVILNWIDRDMDEPPATLVSWFSVFLASTVTPAFSGFDVLNRSTK